MDGLNLTMAGCSNAIHAYATIDHSFAVDVVIIDDGRLVKNH